MMGWTGHKGRMGMSLARLVVAAPLFAATLCAPAHADPVIYAVPERTLVANEARQGVASDGTHVYAIDNSRIVRYALDGGAKVAEFSGDPAQFPHINSCTLIAADLVCALSNYPAVPQIGSVEFFDPMTLAHRRSLPLPQNPGSLTAVLHHDGQWWAAFAQYDAKGGVPSKSHRDTLIAQVDKSFAVGRSWTLPSSVLERIAPYSLSGLAWGTDGKLYASGHDKPEIYVLDVPPQGSVLRHVSTFATATFGQAIDFDPVYPALLWSIDRKSRTVVASRVPSFMPRSIPTPPKE